jgi:DHA1 family inner membrane transport protein
MSAEFDAENNLNEKWHIRILAAIQIVHILDFVIMMPLGATFIRIFNVTPVEFSTLVSAYTISAGIFSILGAPYADRFNRKSFLLFNFLGFMLGTLLCAVSDNFSSLLSGRILAGAFGGMLNACVLSFVSDIIPFHRRGAAMGIVMSAFSIASVAGVPIGLWIANAFNWNAAFYFILIFAFFILISSFLVLPSIRAKSNHITLAENFNEFKKILTQRLYLQSFLLTGTLAFGIFMIIPFIGPYLVKNVGLKETELPYIYLAGGSGTILMARFVGKMSDRLGCFKVFKRIIFISAIPIFLLTTLTSKPLWMILIVSTLFTMFASTRLIPAMTLISGVVSSKERGAFMSIENSGRHLCSGIASQVAGLIIGSTIDGKLTNYHLIGFLCVLFSFISLVIAKNIDLKIKLKTHSI